MNPVRPLLAIASGIILTLAFPRWNLSLAVWVWMFPLLYALWSSCGERKLGRSFGLGWLAGLAFFLPNLAWVRHSSRVIAGAEDETWVGWGPELMGFGAVLGLSVYLALYWGLWAAFAATVGRPRISADGRPAAGDAGRLFSSSLESLRSAFLTAGAWAACEWLRGIVFTGFGWNGLGVALHSQTALIQSADLVGVTGLSFLPVFTACILYNNILRFRQEVRTSRVRPHADFWLASALVLLNFGYGALKLSQSNGETVSLRVLLVQLNVPQWLKWEGRSDPRIGDDLYQGHGRLTQIGAVASPPDLVIWPESALSAPFHDPNHIPFLNDVLALGDFSLLTGADILAPNEPAYTGAALMRGSFDNHQLHRKVHLVPFGEYLPLRGVPGVEALLGGVLPGDFESGTSIEPLVLEKPAGIQLIPLICFEDTVGRLARKFIRPVPQLLVNLTNDGWFLQSHENEVHLVNALFRCIELRRPMARACNTGVTCFIDAQGRIGKGDLLADPRSGSPFIKGTLPETTFYARFGDAFSVTLLFLCAAAAAASFIKRRRAVR